MIRLVLPSGAVLSEMPVGELHLDRSLAAALDHINKTLLPPTRAAFNLLCNGRVVRTPADIPTSDVATAVVVVLCRDVALQSDGVAVDVTTRADISDAHAQAVEGKIIDAMRSSGLVASVPSAPGAGVPRVLIELVSCLSTCIFPDKTTFPIDETMIQSVGEMATTRR